MAMPIKGTKSNDLNLVGTNRADKLQGKNGDDFITGGKGNDDIDGGQGFDTAVFSGSFSDYVITVKGTGNDKVTVADTVANRDGTDSLKKVEALQFSDVTIRLDQNNAPVLADDNATTHEDTPVTTSSVLANDTDFEGDSLSITGNSQGANGSVAYNNDGTFTYTPNLNFNGSDSFTYTVSDGSLSSTATVHITINAVNDEPTLTIADTAGAMTEGNGAATLTDSGALSFADVDATDVVTVSQTYNNNIVWSGGTLDAGVAAALVAGFSVDQDSWDYSSSQDLDFLGEGETITFSYDVVATDDSGAANDTSDLQTVTMTITGTADNGLGDLLAVAYINSDGINGYDASADTLIAGLFDTNGDNIVSAGDTLRTDFYPLDFEANSLGEFRVKDHIVVAGGFSVDSEGLTVSTSDGDFFEFARQAEWGEAFEAANLDQQIGDGHFTAFEDYISVIEGSGTSDPDTTVSDPGLAGGFGDQSFIDVDFYI